jgi:hypothetical protein
MQDTAIPKKMLYGKLYATRRRGRPKTRWLGDVSTDLIKMGINEWRGRAREMFGGVLEWRPRPTPGCSTIEEEEEDEEVCEADRPAVCCHTDVSEPVVKCDMQS